MIDLGRSVMAQLKHGTMTEQDLVHYLQDNYPVTQICQTCAELIMGSGMIEKPKIVITQLQFESFFKVVGYKQDGSPETRGRKPRREMETDLAMGDPELL